MKTKRIRVASSSRAERTTPALTSNWKTIFQTPLGHAAAIFAAAFLLSGGPAQAKSRPAQKQSGAVQSTPAQLAVRAGKFILPANQRAAAEQVEERVAAPAAPDVASSNNYVFATNTAGSLTNMTGSTQLVAAAQDDTASANTPIGFEFFLQGIRYTQFSATSNGFVGLSSTGGAVSNSNYSVDLGTAALPLISACGGDLETGTAGKVHYKVTGAAPSRVLTVEFLNMGITYNNVTSDGTFQVRLHETTGQIEFVYGSMSRGPLTGAGVGNSGNLGIGYSVAAANGSLVSIVSATNTATTTTPFTQQAYPTGPIANLDSAADGSRRVYSLTPPVPTAPTGLNFTGVTPVAMTLNWTDSPDEQAYAIYRSTDGINYAFAALAAQDATSFSASGLSPSTNYFWKVYAISEGALSATALSGSQATSAPGNITSNGTGGGNWSVGATWSGGIVPTATDNVTVVTGDTVIDDASVAFSLTVQNGATLQFDSTLARTLTVATSVTINSGGTFQSNLTGAALVHSLVVGTDLINNGTLDFSTNGDTAGASITFTGAANNTFGGSGAVTDIRALTINKGTSNANILELNPSNLTVRGTVVDGAPMAFLTLTNGTLKVSGNYTMTGRVFAAAAYTIGPTAGFWLNNPNFTVAAQAGNATDTGLFRLTQGTYNVGTAASNSLIINSATVAGTTIIEGGVLNVAGGLRVNAATNAVNYTQTAGTVTVCTVGMATNNVGNFDLGTNAGSLVTMSGGTVVIQSHATGTGTIDYRYDADPTNLTGTVIQFGNASSGTAKAFNLLGVFPNIVITNTSANHTATLSNTLVNFYHVVTGNITINAGNTLSLGGNATSFQTFLEGNITNNGILNGSNVNMRTFLSGTTPQTYSGTGVMTAPLNSLDVDNPAGVNFTCTNQQVVNRIDLFDGSITGGSKLTLGTAGATANVVQLGNGTPPQASTGTIDGLTFNLGANGESVFFGQMDADRSTGAEINPTRSLSSVNFDMGGTNLTLAGGDLTCTGATAFGTATDTAPNGRVITGANTLISGSAGTVTRTGGLGHVDGNFKKTFAAAASKTFEVGTANGFSPVAVTATAGTFPADFTVKATQNSMPGISGANKLARYWTLNGSGITANLTFTYLATDVTGTPASYQFIKNSGGTLSTLPPDAPPTATSATISGISSFSDWTLAEAPAVQAGSLQFSAPNYDDPEGNIGSHNATITVTRTGGTDGIVSVHYATSDDSATTADNDYVATSGDLNWAAGDAADKTFTVTVNGDIVAEGNETVDLTLSAPTGSATLGSPNPATLTITNDDVAVLPSFSVDDVTMNEGNAGPTSYVFTVTKAGVGPATVDFQTQNGTATAPSDYASNNGTLTFGPTDTTMQVTVTVNGDTTPEPNETFTVHLLNASVGSTISDADGLGTITNDDGPPSTVYVDDNWVGTMPGTDPDGAGPATSFGYDAFATIGDGVNGVAVGGTVNVYAGDYPLTSNVAVNKSVTILGPNNGNSPNSAINVPLVRMPEAVVNGNGGPINGSSGKYFNIVAGTTTFTMNGFTFTNFDGTVIAEAGGAALTNVDLHQNIFDTNNGGLMYKFNLATATTVLFTDNKVANQTMTGVNTALLFMGNLTNSHFDNNSVSNIASRELVNLYDSLTSSTISNNSLTNTAGLALLAANQNMVTFDGNTITSTNTPAGVAPIYVSSNDGRTITNLAITNNIITTVTGGGIGIRVSTDTATAASITGVTISGNTISGTSAYGLDLDTFANTGTGTISNVMVQNNQFVNNAFGPMLAYARVTSGTNVVSNLTLQGNTFTENASIFGASFVQIDLRNISGINTIDGNTYTLSGVLPGGTTSLQAIGIRGSQAGTFNVTNNNLNGGGVLHNGAATVFQSGIRLFSNDATTGALPNTAVIDAHNNFINGWEDGVVVRDGVAAAYGGLAAGTQVKFNNDDLSGNSLESIRSGTGELVNASSNWWGTVAEASVLAQTTGNVTITPYLNSATDTNMTPGFQGDFSVLHVTTLGAAGNHRAQDGVYALTSGGTLKIHAGIYAGELNTLPKPVIVSPGASPAQVSLGTYLIMDSDDTLAIEINGTNPATDYDNLIVNGGGVNLDDATLSLSGTHSPVPGQTFTIIDKQTIGPVSGTFAGLPEGAIISNFLGSGYDAQISYVGGDGNDVVVSVLAPIYTLTYTAGPNGSISGTSPQTVPQGGSGTPVTAVPNACYHFVNWSDGSTDNPRTDTNVQMDISVMANFAINTYTLTYTAGPNGSISGTSPQMLNCGSDGTAVTAVPDAGYHFVNWSDSSTANPRTDTNVMTNISVMANFAANPSFSINDVTQAETNAGQTSFIFTVSKAGSGASSVDFQTQNGTATAPSDYATNSGTLTFGPTDTTMQVTVTVNGDTTPEPNETFTVQLSNPSGGATISDATGLGTITNDDGPPSTVYVDDNWVGTTPGADPDGAGPATSFGFDAFATIQTGVDGVASPGNVIVYAGTYDEDVAANKANVTLFGTDGPSVTMIRGPIGGDASTIHVLASNVTIAGFTITRLGNNTTDWNNPGLNSIGVAVQGQAITNMLVRDNIIIGNRTGIDVNNSNGHTIRNNTINDNRTGLIFRNQTDNITVEENFISNNWTVGIVFLDGSGGTNVPPQSAHNSTFSNNDLSANWYGQIVDRQSGGSIPAPGTTNLKNFRGDWFGTPTPSRTTANSMEPGYAAQIPVEFGGTATPPGGQPDIEGPASDNFKIDPVLTSGTDTNIETTPGRGTNGFQGVANTVVVSPADQHGWFFFDDDPGVGTGSGGFEHGPAMAPLGLGSAYLQVDDMGRFGLATTAYAGTRMSDITSLVYNSYQNNNTNTVVAAALQFDIDYDLNDASNNYEGRLVFEPYLTGTVQQNVWQNWDAVAGKWYGTRTTVTVNGASVPNPCTQGNPCTWNQVLTNFPNAGVRNTPASALLFKAGGPWAPGFDGNVDAFTIKVNDASAVYDFEPTPTAGTFQFSAANYDDTETNSGSHNVTVTVSRTGGTDGAVSVHYATSDGSATTADNDYAATSGDLNWAMGDVADKTFTVTVNGDNTYEPDETINLTLSAPTGGAMLGTPNPATITILNDDPVPNTPPSITAATGVTRQQGSTISNSTIATVNDTESGAGAVVVTVTSANPSNGVTISNIVNTAGTVTADVAASCSATDASFTLQASDGSLTATDTLNVTVVANPGPTLTYGNSSVPFNGSTTINPASGPADNGSVSSIVVQSSGTYTGTISVDNGTGIISISNAAPIGPHAITIRATDNCGAITDATFTLTVDPPPCVPPNTVYVNASWAGTMPGTDPDGAGPATAFGCDSFATIQDGINGVAAPGDVIVYAGTYDEDVAANKANVTLFGTDGPSVTMIRGPIGGDASTIHVLASNVTIAGFTITRLGNNTTDWNNPGLNSIGVAVQGQAITNMLVRDNIIIGNRTGIDVNNSNGHTIRNNTINDNRTGLIFRNQTDNITVEENFISNNWTVGIVFLDGSGGTNVPPQSAHNSTFSNNDLSANWYGQIVDRQSGGSIPAPGTTNLKNFRGDWFGTPTPSRTTANSMEPGYAAQIPVEFGGTATPPGGQPDIEGPASDNFKIDPVLTSGTDTNIETTPGRGTNGFQGVANTVVVSPADQHGWFFFDDDPGVGTGSGGFEHGPAMAPLGLGSAYLQVDDMGRFGLATTAYAGTRMSDITSLVYNSYQNNNTNTVVAAALQFDIDYDLNDASNNYEGRLVFEPYLTGTVQQNVWQNWDAVAGKWYGTRTTVTVNGASVPNPCTQGNPCTWNQVLTNFPNAGVRNTPASALLFKAGGPWAPGFDGNVDAFTVKVNDASAVYDFEPTPTAGTLQFSASNYDDTETNSGSHAVTVTVSRTGGSDGAVSVHYATSDGSATTADNDYAATSGDLNWTAGDVADKTFTVTVNGDSTYEADEMINLTLSAPTGGAMLGTPNPATITILNDDPSPSFSIDNVTQVETDSGQTAFVFTVSKTGSTALSSSVDFQTMDGSATTSNNDYVGNSGTLTFGPADTAMQITVMVNGDTTFEPNETFTVHLSNASNATISDADGTGTITNDDGEPTFTIDDVTHPEGNSGQTAFVFTVSKNGASGQSSTVSYATVPGTATTGDNDYVATSGTLIFGPTDTSMQVTVFVNGDTNVESDETFSLVLTSVVNNGIKVVNGALPSGLGTILNDDLPPPPIVYVDDNWVGTTPGTDPDGAGPATNFGYDAFATIQDGVNGVANPGTVIVYAGTYPEAVTVNKQLTMLGAQAGNNANTRFAAFATGPNGPKANPAVEAILTAAATAPASGANDTLHIMASNVTFDGFVVDGNNPALAQGGAVPIGGVNTDARTGIQTEDAAGSNFSATNLLIRNNIVQNFAGANNSNLGGGITLVNPTDLSTATVGSVVTANLVRNFGAYGIELSNNAYADVTFNTVDTPAYPDANAGIWVYDFPNNGAGTKTINIANNNVTVGQDNFGGIWINLVYAPLATVNVTTNTVNAAVGVTAADDFTYGIYLSSLLNGTAAHLSGNTVGSAGGTFDRGIAVWNVGTSPTDTTVSNGTVGHSAKGITLHYDDPNFGPAGVSFAAKVSGMTVSGTQEGVFVDANGSGANTVTMAITNSTLSGNTAANGGALHSVGTSGSASTTVTNSTLNGNSPSGASILLQDASLTVGNSIFNGGTSGTTISALGTSLVTSLGYNLSSDNFGGFLTGTGEQVNTDPILGPLKNNGGPTFTHAPLSDSPALDRGKDLGPIGPSHTATGEDQRASTRPVTYDASIIAPAGGDRSDIGAVELPPGVIPTSANSRKTHGAAGDFDINLPLSGPVGIECRSGGATNDYQVIITFATPVTYNTAAVNTGTGSVSSSSGSGTNQITVNLTGVTNAQRVTIALFGVTDGPNSGDVGVRMGVLVGDVTGAGGVTATDVSQVKLDAGNPVGMGNFRDDVLANGVINATDISITKINSGTALP